MVRTTNIAPLAAVAMATGGASAPWLVTPTTSGHWLDRPVPLWRLGASLATMCAALVLAVAAPGIADLWLALRAEASLSAGAGQANELSALRGVEGLTRARLAGIARFARERQPRLALLNRLGEAFPPNVELLSFKVTPTELVIVVNADAPDDVLSRLGTLPGFSVPSLLGPLVPAADAATRGGERVRMTIGSRAVESGAARQ